MNVRTIAEIVPSARGPAAPRTAGASRGTTHCAVETDAARKHGRPYAWRHRGLTLIEAAIVLAIIGVVMASVLQGRQLIASAEYKSFRQALGDYAEAFHVFRNRYNALPGDLDDAVATADLNQNGGNGDGVIDQGPTCDADSDESCLAWQHLRAASLLKGNPGTAGAAAPPAHVWSGRISGFFTGDQGNSEFGHKLFATGVPVEIARRLDVDVDDGLCNGGAVSSASGCDGSEWDTTAATANVVYAL